MWNFIPELNSEQAGTDSSESFLYLPTTNEVQLLPTTTKKNSITERINRLPEDELGILDIFENGLPCRSKLLPKSVFNDTNVASRPSEIMTGFCKVLCISEYNHQ